MENQIEQKPLKKSKKWWIIFVVVILLILGIAITRTVNKSTKLMTSQEDIEKLKSSARKDLTYAEVVSNPEKYKGEVVQWGAKVFTDPEKDNDGVYFQAYEGGDNNNFAISYGKPDFNVKDDDFIIVIGKISGKFKGTNAFGAKLEIPAMEAISIEKATRNDVVAPTESTVSVNKSDVQHEFSVTLDKIELAKNETRFFVKLKNDGKDTVNFYDFNSKVTQGSKQYESESSYDTGKDLPSEILPGVEVEGIVLFPAIDKEQKQLTVHLDKPSGGDYSLDWKEIKFDVVMP